VTVFAEAWQVHQSDVTMKLKYKNVSTFDT